MFIGHAEADHRIRYVTDMAEAGVRLRIYSPPKEWHRLLPERIRMSVPPISPVWGEEYARTIAEAPICLAFHSEWNRDRCSYRVFEIPACGGFLLAFRTDVMQSLYEEGKEAEFFGSSGELIDKIRYYLRNEGARQEIARRGRERCLRSGYDVVSRMRQWAKDTGEFRGA